MLAQEEARELLDAIDTSTLVGLRDRALIATMIYTFGRVAAVIKMRVEEYYTQGRRGWVRLHEKVSKRHEMPCNHNLEAYLDAYIRRRRSRRRPQGILISQYARQNSAVDDQSPRSGRCLPDDSSPGVWRRHQDSNRQSYVSCDRDYAVPAQRRPARARAADGGQAQCCNGQRIEPTRQEPNERAPTSLVHALLPVAANTIAESPPLW